MCPKSSTATARAVGTYTIGPQAVVNNSLPAGIKGLCLFAEARWTTAAVANSIAVSSTPFATSITILRIRAYVANFNISTQGIVTIGTNGDFDLSVVGATATYVLARCVGYFL